MSAITQGQRETLANDLYALATEATDQARRASTHPDTWLSPDVSLAAKNWSAAALAATQAYMTATRGSLR